MYIILFCVGYMYVEGGETCTHMHATSTPHSRYTAMNFINICTDDDADLEAELLALEGKAPKKGGNSKAGGKGALSMADVDSMLAGIGDIGEVGSDDEEDMSDDDEELLGELQVGLLPLPVI